MDKKRLDSEELWRLYVSGKQTYEELSLKFGCSSKTIQRRLDSVKLLKNNTFSASANVIMDTTYFGRKYGVMAFKNSIDGAILLLQEVKHETLKLYEQGIAEISRRGITVQAIVCDGKRGIFDLFPEIPMQMCQFHMIKIINKYLTRKPKTQAAIELRIIILQLTKLSKKDFTDKINTWYLKWQKYVNERTPYVSPQGKKRSFYTHKRLRTAYLSIIKHLPYLFTFEDYPNLNIPNTTNALDGHFSALKNKLRNHNGLSKRRKIKFIDGFFKA